VIWVGHELFPISDVQVSPESGAVFRTTNGNTVHPSWERVDAGLPKRHCNRIVVDPTNDARAFALFGGYEADNLWVTADGGQHWTAVGNAQLPAVPAYDLAFHPDDKKVLILANETGIFFSGDNGQTWSPGNQGPTNCAVFQLVWMNRSLVVGTHGRGVFRFDLPPPGATTLSLTVPAHKPVITAVSP